MGAKKKKGLASRLAKMSDEDRARYMQHRADMEEESRRRKEQLISTFLKNKLGKEDGFARLNVAKINQNWHQILRKMKCEDMRQDVKHLIDYTQRLLDLKNRNIEKLIKELDDAEDQYRHNFQTHLNHIDTMIDFGKKSLEDMEEDYEEERLEILEEAKKERVKLLMKVYEEFVYLKTIMFRQENIGKEELKKYYEYYFQRNDDVIRENKREYDEMRKSKEKRIGELWGEISVALRAHVDVTDQKRAHLGELRRLDAEGAAEIASNEALMRRQETEIKQLEEAHEELEKINGDTIEFLSESVETHRRQFLVSKKSLQRNLRLDERNILVLTSKSNAAISEMQDFAVKGEKLLQLMQVCRKLETQNEKILRFNKYPGLEGLEESLPSTPGSSGGEPPIIEDCFTMVAKLDGLWVAYNKVHLNCREMKEEIKFLEGDNAKLKVLLKEMLEEAALEKIQANFNANQEDLYVTEIYST